MLELSVVDELVALDNIDMLKKNGFVLQVDKDAPTGERPKVRLVAQPMSKDTMFDMKGGPHLGLLLWLTRHRPRGDSTPDERRKCERDGAVFQGPGDVCDARVSEFDHDWNCAQAPTYDQRECGVFARTDTDLSRW